MQIHQTRRDELAGIVQNLHLGGGGLGEAGAQAVFTQHIPLPHAQGIRGGGVYKSAFQGETIHRNDLSI